MHFVVAVPPASWRERDHEYMVGRLGSAVIENTFHRTKRLGGTAIVIVIGARDDERLSFVTCGISPELHVTAPRDRDALAFVYSVAHWLIIDPDRPLQDGDTVGRSHDERVPIAWDGEVLRLDLP